MDIFEKLLGDVKLPKVYKVKQTFDRPRMDNIEDEARRIILEHGGLSSIKPGQSIAITAGSRGVANIALIIKSIVALVKEHGGLPFIIPAMGSHGGANSEGQILVLETMGITEDYIDAPIRSSMEVIEIGRTEKNLPIHIDKYANEADGIIVINRIKPHVAFRGKYESGLAKMVTIGLGKQKGAEMCHRMGFGKMAENIEEISRKIVEKKNIVLAVGLLENAYDETCEIIPMRKDEIFTKEPALLERAMSNLPKIFFDNLDVLVIDEIGKNITGTGMDTNIIGRYHTPYASGGPNISKIVVLDLTEESHGNANGIGLADFTTSRLFNKMKFDQTYPNSITSTVQISIKIPMVLNTDKLAIQGAIKTSNIEDFNKVRLMRIKNTLDLEYAYISESLYEEAKSNPYLEIVGEMSEFEFNKHGDLPEII
ncbi:lactate racemase domain-containing protein [Gudongella sp. DL1XJH-153]|uniref:lactate racemase domain-containing protein n=1 Tax=Gudongella sp. DL1XJH-153 TaxID=3409804 RepID=UPI003BB7B0AB